jgi:hypothetical protein
MAYDVTNVYFEGLAEGNALAQRGYSRDHRPDRKRDRGSHRSALWRGPEHLGHGPRDDQ